MEFGVHLLATVLRLGLGQRQGFLKSVKKKQKVPCSHFLNREPAMVKEYKTRKLGPKHEYSKNPLKRNYVFQLQAEAVLIYQVLGEKSHSIYS